MKTGNRIIVATVATLTVIGCGATLSAALAAEGTNGSESSAWHHGGGAHGRGAPGGMLQVLRELTLSDMQKQQVRALLGSAREQWQSQSSSAVNDLPALGNPGDPNHAAAVQAAQARAAQRIQHWSDVEQQIYGILTPAQQAQLPQLLAQWQSQATARRNAHKAAAPQ